MDFLNKTEVIKQYKQYVMYSRMDGFFSSIVQNFQRLKILWKVKVYKKTQSFCMRVMRLMIYFLILNDLLM